MRYYRLLKIHAIAQYLSEHIILVATACALTKDSKVHEPKYCLVVIMCLLSDNNILET